MLGEPESLFFICDSVEPNLHTLPTWTLYSEMCVPVDYFHTSQYKWLCTIQTNFLQDSPFSNYHRNDDVHDTL